MRGHGIRGGGGGGGGVGAVLGVLHYSVKEMVSTPTLIRVVTGIKRKLVILQLQCPTLV